MEQQVADDYNGLAYEGPFVGSRTCQGCHPDEYAQWLTTPHAFAWRTLEAEKRSTDLECYTCHATGTFHELGPKHPLQLGDLVNVGCEACHGPGKLHVTNPDKGQMSSTVPIGVCTDCHDGVKDEGRFDPQTYYPKVVHEGIGN